MKPISLAPQPFDVPPPDMPQTGASLVKVTGNITGNKHDADMRDNPAQYSNRPSVDKILSQEGVASRHENKI